MSSSSSLQPAPHRNPISSISSSSSSHAQSQSPQTSTPSQRETNTNSNSVNNTTNATRHQEDRLGLTWRTIASSLVIMTQKAERAAQDEQNIKANLKELDDSVVAFLRNRQEWLRILSYLEAKLEGHAKEMEVLQHYNASVSRLETKKRKRDDEAVQVSAEQAVRTEPST